MLEFGQRFGVMEGKQAVIEPSVCLVGTRRYNKHHHRIILILLHDVISLRMMPLNLA
jgi:hypothetical protein